MSDIDTAAADSLKVLDPERPIREADMAGPAAGSTRSLVTLMRRGVATARQSSHLHFTELKIIDVRAQTWQIGGQTNLGLCHKHAVRGVR